MCIRTKKGNTTNLFLSFEVFRVHTGLEKHFSRVFQGHGVVFSRFFQGGYNTSAARFRCIKCNKNTFSGTFYAIFCLISTFQGFPGIIKKFQGFSRVFCAKIFFQGFPGFLRGVRTLSCECSWSCTSTSWTSYTH